MRTAENPSVRVLRSEPLFFLLLTLVIGVYVVWRAARVPWVHDECASLFWYVERGHFLPGKAHLDANNHFLSTAIGVLVYKLGGLSLLCSRLGSLLAWPIYAWASYRIGLHLAHRNVRWIMWIALLACPFLLDFFSLFRGYALQIAFWTVAIDGGLRYASGGRSRHLMQLLVGLLLANAAVLSLVPVWAMIVAAVAIPAVRNWYFQDDRPTTAQVLTWTVLGVIPLCMATMLSVELQRSGLLYHGSTDSFLQVTVISLGRYVWGNGSWWSAVLVILILIGAMGMWWSRQGNRISLAILGGFLLIDVAARIAMANVLGVNYAEDRAALYLVPPAIMLIGFALDAAAKGPRWWYRVLLLALCFLPVRTLYTANLDHTLLWPEQSVPTRFLERIAAGQEAMQRPVIIGAYHQLALAIPYAARLHGLDLDPPNKEGFPDGPHDMRIVDGRHLDSALVGWEEVDHAPGPGLHLLVPQRRLRTSIFARRTRADTITDAAFIWLRQADTIRLAENVMVQVRGELRGTSPHQDLRLVCTLDSAGVEIQQVDKALGAMRPRWRGEELHTMLFVPGHHGADQRHVYIWNPNRDTVHLGAMEMKWHRLPTAVPH